MPGRTDDLLLRPSDWTYRVEGALHMLFAYTGSHPRLANKVLRLETSRTSGKPRRDLHQQYEFTGAVFCLGPLKNFVHQGYLIAADEAFLRQLGHDAHPLRPLWRAHADIVVESAPSLLIQPDCARIFNPMPSRHTSSLSSSLSSSSSSSSFSSSRYMPSALTAPPGVTIANHHGFSDIQLGNETWSADLKSRQSHLSDLHPNSYSFNNSFDQTQPLQTSVSCDSQSVKSSLPSLDLSPLTICVEVKPKAALTCVSRLVSTDICNALDKFGTLSYALKNYPSTFTEEACTECRKKQQCDDCVQSQGGADTCSSRHDSKDDEGSQHDFDIASTSSRDSECLESSFDCGCSANSPPRYCPADLLSGVHEKIASALDALRRRRAHSLRVFYDGRVFLADDIPIDGVFTSREEAYESSFCKSAIEASARALADSNFAYGILETQRKDFIDALGAEKVWNRLVELHDGSEKDAEAAVWEAYFVRDETHPELISKVEVARNHLSYPSSSYGRDYHSDELVQEAEEYLATIEPDVAARIIADFMVASVIKDCSVMVSMSMQPANYSPSQSESAVTLPNGTVCVYRVEIVDLEPKPISKIRKWAARDRARAAQRCPS